MSKATMRKHERECFKAAKEILEPLGFEVWAGRHGRLTKLKLHAQKGQVFSTKTICSTPRTSKADLGKTLSWAKKVAQM